MNKPTQTHGELGPEAEMYRTYGCWSAFGMAANVQARPLSVYGDKTFYLQAPQVWVIQELFTDEYERETSDPLEGRC